MFYTVSPDAPDQTPPLGSTASDRKQLCYAAMANRSSFCIKPLTPNSHLNNQVGFAYPWQHPYSLGIFSDKPAGFKGIGILFYIFKVMYCIRTVFI